MNVLHVNDVANVGYVLVKELASMGVNAKLLVLKEHYTSRYAGSYEDFVVRVTDIDGLFRLMFKNWDIIHVHYLRIPAYVASLAITPIILHVHGSDIRLAYDKSLYEGLIHRSLKYLTLKRSRRVLVSTPNLIALVKGILPDVRNLSYLPNPIDTSYFNCSNARRLSEYFASLRDGVEVLITMPTRVHFKTKGNHILAKILASINTSKDYRLVMVRDGPDLPKLLELLGRTGLRRRALFINPIPNRLMPGFYGVSDIVVAAISKSEVFGVTALESMACKTPTINTWSRRYYGDTGFQPIPYNLESLSIILEELINDPSTRRKIADVQEKWVKRTHNSKIIAEKLLRIYREST